MLNIKLVMKETQEFFCEHYLYLNVYQSGFWWYWMAKGNILFFSSSIDDCRL